MLKKYPYLYNCAECGAKVKVSTTGVKRTCKHEDAVINAPRRVILTGDGTLNNQPISLKISWYLRKILTHITGRCI